MSSKVESTPVHVRPATKKDGGAIAEANILSWRKAYEGIVPSSYLDELDVDNRTEGMDSVLGVTPGPDTPKILVAERDSEVVGFATVGKHRDEPATGVGEIWALYVHPDHWRSGVGTALLDATRRRFEAQAIKTGYLWVFEDNRAGRDFYEANGWVLDETSEPREIEIGGDPVTEVRYVNN